MITEVVIHEQTEIPNLREVKRPPEAAEIDFIEATETDYRDALKSQMEIINTTPLESLRVENDEWLEKSRTIYNEEMPRLTELIDEEKLNPEDYLSETQINIIEKIYKKLGYTDEEIEEKLQEYAKKARACKEAEEKGLENLSSKEKGNYGEMKTDLDMLDKGYVRISKKSITSLDDKGHQGIDGVYENPDADKRYFVVDSKYGTSQLSDTKDGKQMSDEWIDTRLDEAVGKEKADEIRAESIENPDNIGKAVAHIDSDGNVTYTDIDGNEKEIVNNKSGGTDDEQG